MSITYQDIESAQFIKSCAYSDYFFISASFIVEIEIAGNTHEIVLQTGHSYKYNDYSMPCNTLSIYTDDAMTLPLSIEQNASQDFADQSIADDINAECDTNLTVEQISLAYNDIADTIIECQLLVSEAEREAEAALENDTRIFVVEDCYSYDEFDRKRIAGMPQLHTFDDDGEADEYISEHERELLRFTKITAEHAASAFGEFFELQTD